MSKPVSRDKYESIKEKANKWRDKSLEYQMQNQDIEKLNNELRSEINLLTERCKELNNQIKQFQKEKKKQLLVEELSKHFVSKE